MIEIAPNLHVGSDQDARHLSGVWAVVHAAKEPWHREVVGYAPGRGAPADHPERLVARRGRHLYLNLVDVPRPNWIADSILDAAIEHTREYQQMPVLIHCNQGLSRSPWLAALVAHELGLEPWASYSHFEATDHMSELITGVRTQDSGMWLKTREVW